MPMFLSFDRSFAISKLSRLHHKTIAAAGAFSACSARCPPAGTQTKKDHQRPMAIKPPPITAKGKTISRAVGQKPTTLPVFRPHKLSCDTRADRPGCFISSGRAAKGYATLSEPRPIRFSQGRPFLAVAGQANIQKPESLRRTHPALHGRLNQHRFARLKKAGSRSMLQHYRTQTAFRSYPYTTSNAEWKIFIVLLVAYLPHYQAKCAKALLASAMRCTLSRVLIAAPSPL